MSKVQTANETLAQSYRAVAVANSEVGFNETFLKAQRAISASPIDIAAHFHQHGDLDALDVPGIGPKTKHLLQLILKLGRDKALSTVNSDRQARSQDEWNSLHFRDRAAEDDESTNTAG